MARVKYNVVTHGVSGQVGDLLTFIQRHGKTFIGKIQTRSGKVSAKQQAIRDKFILAARYARTAMKDPATKALYELKAGGGVIPFNLAIADYFTAPVIESIITGNYTGAVGSTIQVQATDDTKVTEVRVSVANAAGVVLEQGPAILNPESEFWMYTTMVVNPSLAGSKITAVAKDLPGNSAEKEMVL